MAKGETAKVKVCAQAKFYVSQSKGLSSVQFLEFLALHTHRKRCGHMEHDC